MTRFWRPIKPQYWSAINVLPFGGYSLNVKITDIQTHIISQESFLSQNYCSCITRGLFCLRAFFMSGVRSSPTNSEQWCIYKKFCIFCSHMQILYYFPYFMSNRMSSNPT